MLRAAGLTKRYGTRTVVDGLDLEVSRGDVYGVLGANGAGKSTTLRMLVGLVRPTAGEVHLFGERLAPGRHHLLARVGAIVEGPAFYGELAGRDNLRLLASLTGPCPAARIDAVLDRVGLADRATDPVKIYSHGMKQRLAIAAALLPGPELVLLDEPTNGLDPLGIRELRALIRSLAADDGLTVILSSHLLAEVEQVCRRAIVIAGGRTRWEGEVAELLRERRRLRIVATPLDRAREVLGERVVRVEGDALWLAGDADAADAVATLVAAGIAVREVVPWSPTLEDAFVELVS